MKKIDATLKKHYFHSKMKNNAVLFFIACTVCILGIAPVAAQNSGFGSEKTSWHGYDRYNFVMAELAKGDVPLLNVCGSLDPWLDRETRVAEKKYKELGGNFTVIIKQGEGHFLSFNGESELKPIVDFVIGNIK